MTNIDELKNLASQGDTQAQFNLAVTLLQNREPEGLTWLKEAAKNGHPKAYEVINNMDEHNTEDDDKVINAILENATKGDVNAQYALGIHFELGQFGLEVSVKRALYCYEQAIANGLEGNNLNDAKIRIASIKEQEQHYTTLPKKKASDSLRLRKEELENAIKNAEYSFNWERENTCKFCDEKTAKNITTTINYTYVSTEIRCRHGYGYSATSNVEYIGVVSRLGITWEMYGDERCPKLKKAYQYRQKVEDLKKELEQLLLQDPEYRQKKQEEHYKSLLSRKRNAKSSKDFIDLAKEFRAMNGFMDTEALVIECDRAALKAQEFEYQATERALREKQEQQEKKYNDLLKQKLVVSSEDGFYDLVQQFRELGDYKEARKFADECKNHYQEIKTIREEQEKKEEAKRKRKEEQKQQQEYEFELRKWRIKRSLPLILFALGIFLQAIIIFPILKKMNDKDVIELYCVWLIMSVLFLLIFFFGKKGCLTWIFMIIIAFLTYCLLYLSGGTLDTLNVIYIIGCLLIPISSLIAMFTNKDKPDKPYHMR